MTIRLALIRQRYNPYGGAERFVASTLDALEEYDLSLTLITREWLGGEKKHHVIECRPRYFGRLGRDRSFARCVGTILDRERFDLVQSHERISGCDIFRAGDGVHAAWLEQRTRKQTRLGKFLDRISPWHRFILASEKKMFSDPRLKAVICISELVRNDIRRFYAVPEEKLHLIYNGIDLQRFHPGLSSEHRSPIRIAHSIPEHAPLFLFVGSGFERKGVSTLLQAMSQASPDTHLLIVGQDKHLGRYVKQAARLGLGKRVVFTGGIKDPRPFYGAADAFILPTRYEPLSNAVLEALACGLPSIVSTQCGAAELITPGANGFVCDALDVDTLRTSINRLGETGVASAMRPAAREAVAGLSIESMSARLLELYRQLL